MFKKTLEDFEALSKNPNGNLISEEVVAEQVIAIPVSVIKQIATELGYVPKQEVSDEQIIAALDDYFKTLTDGQYSPMSGEHNNASNNNEVFHIAKKHGVDPAKLMDYLNNLMIFDKFSKDAATRGMVRSIPEVKKGFGKVLEQFEKMVMGEGYDMPSDPGMVEGDIMNSTRTVACPNCIGDGTINHKSCPVCHGSAHIPAEMAARWKASHRKGDREGIARVPESRTKNGPVKPKINPVSKNMGTFNHARVFRDKKKDYKRSDKHKNSVSEGKKISVYQQRLMNFLDDMHESYEMKNDKIFVGQGVYNHLCEKFPEFNGMVFPINEFEEYTTIRSDNSHLSHM